MESRELNSTAVKLADIAGFDISAIGTVCVRCRKPIKEGVKDEPGVNVYSQAGAREAKISGMCETCFDSKFADGLL